MMETADLERQETEAKASEFRRQADSLVLLCWRKHAWCVRCRSKSACQRNYDKLGPIAVTSQEFALFVTELRRLERVGN